MNSSLSNCSLSFLIAIVITAAILIGMASEATASVPPEQANATEWPVRDQEGFVQAYKHNNRWVNWWARDRYGAVTFMSRIWMEKDNSNIPDERTLNETLPVKRPFWINNATSINHDGVGHVRATWLGHATVLAEVDGAVVLTDPIFSDRASAVQWAGPKRYRPPACNIDELPPKIDAVVISHDHYDHLDFNSVKTLNQRYGSSLNWFVPKDLGSWFTSNFNISDENVHEMIWWEQKAIPNAKNNVEIACLPSNHWCRRGMFDENRALWSSWAVIGPRKRFWFGGDTAYAECFKQIGQRYGPFDLSAIPIGAYEPQWFMKFVHVNPAEAVQIHQDIRSKKSLGIHWGTFKLTYEHYLEPRSLTKEKLAEKGISERDFQVINIGESVKEQDE